MISFHLKEWALRVLALFVLLSFILAFLITILFIKERLEYREQYHASSGYLSLTQNNPYAEPVYLNGMWDSFEGVVCESEQDVRSLGQATGHARFPISSITQAKKNATYRLRFSLGTSEQEPLFLYVSTFYKSAHVYLNGTRQYYLDNGDPGLKSSTMESSIPLNALDPDAEWQELVISGPFAEMPVTLHHRAVVIGTMKNISSLAVFSSSNEMFLFGLLLLILVNGYVFMLFRPSHRIISYMTLFDTMILMRTVLSMNYVVSFFKDIFPWIPVSDRLGSSLSLFFLMLGGVVGCKLSAALYDPRGEAPQWLIKPLPWIYATFALVFPHTPLFFEQYGKKLLIVTYLVTFVGIFLQYRRCWINRERRIYNFLQLIKTIYIGALLFVDILIWSSAPSLLFLFYLYGVFFLLHIVVRLYDNNESYREVEVLNANLESTVRQRTQELYEANQVLSELSIKDPLTQSFNRLYFEQAMEQALANFEPDKPIHLCIFDLDLFKQINDTYGHGAGDEQLKATVKLVNAKVGSDVVFSRFGGEEFVLLFCGMPRDAVMHCIEQVQKAIALDASKNERRTTASFGVSAFYLGDTAKQLMKRADLALYEAKRSGRNCIATNFEETSEGSLPELFM